MPVSTRDNHAALSSLWVSGSAELYSMVAENKKQGHFFRPSGVNTFWSNDWCASPEMSIGNCYTWLGLGWGGARGVKSGSKLNKHHISECYINASYSISESSCIFGQDVYHITLCPSRDDHRLKDWGGGRDQDCPHYDGGGWLWYEEGFDKKIEL